MDQWDFAAYLNRLQELSPLPIVRPSWPQLVCIVGALDVTVRSGATSQSVRDDMLHLMDCMLNSVQQVDADLAARLRSLCRYPSSSTSSADVLPECVVRCEAPSAELLAAHRRLRDESLCASIPMPWVELYALTVLAHHAQGAEDFSAWTRALAESAMSRVILHLQQREPLLAQMLYEGRQVALPE
jgi:hypothetical protein